MRWRYLTAVLLGTSLVAGGCGGDDTRDGDGKTLGSGCESDVSPQIAAGENVFQFEGRAAAELEDDGQDVLSGQEIPAQDRAYLLALPDGYDDDTPDPLILNFHGVGSDKDAHESETAVAATATARGYVVVTPDALPKGEGAGNEWSIFGEAAEGADFVVLSEFVTELSRQLCIDAGRIYVVGHGAGSYFAGFFGCRGQAVAATAMVGGLVPPTCEPERTPSVIAIHGTADPSAPYDGGDVGIQVPMPGVIEVLGFYAGHFGCEEPATKDEVSPGVKRQQLLGCPEGEMALYSIQDGDGAWPVAGSDPSAFDATTTILDFFDEHPG